MLTVGQKISYYRRNRNLTQKDVESKTGIPQTTLSNWERDKSEPTITELGLILNCIGVTIIQFLLKEADAEEQKLSGTN